MERGRADRGSKDLKIYLDNLKPDLKGSDSSLVTTPRRRPTGLAPPCALRRCPARRINQWRRPTYRACKCKATEHGWLLKLEGYGIDRSARQY
jgi:hypothetical protein